MDTGSPSRGSFFFFAVCLSAIRVGAPEQVVFVVADAFFRNVHCAGDLIWGRV